MAATLSSVRHATRARPLPLFLAASLAAHALVVLLLPGRTPQREGAIETLEVTLVRAESPRAVEPPTMRSAPPEPKKRPPRREEAVKRAEPAPPRPHEPRPEVLALPQQPAQQPVFNATPPEPAPPAAVPDPTAVAGARQDGGRTGAKGDASGDRGAPLTPPSFNAAYLRNPAPRYPVIARRNGEQGTVMLKVLVTREGAAATVSVEKTSGSTALDQAAVEAVRNWRFTPARQGAQSVEAWVLVPIVFRLEGTP